MKDTTVYKVVEDKKTIIDEQLLYNPNLKRSKRRFCSCVVYNMEFVAVSYEIGKTTKPKFGKLLAFSTLAKAKAFCGLGQIILECKAKNVKKQEWVSLVFTNSIILKMFWGNQPVIRKVAPSGTVTCDSIIPIKIVS